MQAVNDYKQAGGVLTGFDLSYCRASTGCIFIHPLHCFGQAHISNEGPRKHFGHPFPCQDLEAPALPEREYEASKRYFGTLGDAMLSCLARAHGVKGNAFSGLFMSITGGVSWEEVLGPLKAISFVWVVLYLFYIAFTHLGGEAVPTRPRYFAVLNVLTAVPRRCRPEDVFALL